VNIKTTLKSSVAVAALFAVAAPVANAADDTFKTGNKNSLTMSGRVAQAIWYADDGSSEDMFITDGSINGTRIRWVAKGTLNANVTAGATYEMDLMVANDPGSMTLGGAGTQTNVTDGTDSAASTFALRHSYVWVSHKKMGKISLGQTSVASDGTGETNLTGGGFAGVNQIASYGSAIRFVETTTSAAPSASAYSISSVFGNYDAGGREEVLRYDTPTFMGFQAKVGLITTGNWDAGLFYSGKFGPLQVQAKAGYYDGSMSGSTNTPIVNYKASASVAVLHDSGLNAAFNIGKQNIQSSDNASGLQATIEDPQTVYWTVGYKAKIFGVGGTNFEVSYANTDDKVVTAGFDDSDATMWGVSAKQSFDAIGASVSIQYMNFEVDANNAGTALQFDDIDVFVMETMFKF